MSPASKSKSKDKSASRVAKEQPKVSPKPAPPANGGNGNLASAYNPVSGTFHAIETVAPSASLPPAQSNGRFRTIDEMEEHSGSSLGTTAEYDSVSNNDSCSGESEDQQKEKATTGATLRTEPIPGSDTDKREKIRQKNEKKHQRQKERRAQELHERCCGFLMSRKLETLAQKLVAMGFTSEQATMALIQNEGRVDESALWLLEGGDESKRQNAANFDGTNLKIDIADELAVIADLEVKFKCTKQEVERAVVNCEGDLEKAEETMKAQKQEANGAPAKLEEAGEHQTVLANGFHSNKLSTASIQNPVVRTQVKGSAPVLALQQRRDERDFNYTKAMAVAGGPQMDSGGRNLQSPLRKLQSKLDWAKPQVAAPLEKRWPGPSSSPSASYSLAAPLQVAAQAKAEARYAMGGVGELKANALPPTLREPIIMMQRPQSNSMKQNLPSTSVALGASPPVSSGWYPNGTSTVDMMKLANGGLAGQQQLRNLALSGSSQQFYPQNHHQSYISGPVESGTTGWGGSWNNPGTATRTSLSSSSSSLAVPSSLGLFTGWGTSASSGSSSPVDWSTRGSMPQCDYTSIDWSLDSTPLTPSLSSLKADRLYNNNTWHTSYVAAKASGRPMVNGGGGGVCIPGLQEGGLVVDPSPSAAGSHEWTSPFAGKDLLRVPRQFVTSPSSL